MRNGAGDSTMSRTRMANPRAGKAKNGSLLRTWSNQGGAGIPTSDKGG
jgi:hypothetical protein